MNTSVKTTGICILSGCIVVLSGCAATTPMPDLAMIERHEQAVDSANQSAISVEQLLERARGKGSDQPTRQTTLELLFSANVTELSATQQDTLNTYANQLKPQTLNVACAPSRAADSVVAALKGVSRCESVGAFLEKRAHRTSIKLVPSMNRNLVRVQVDN